MLANEMKEKLKMAYLLPVYNIRYHLCLVPYIYIYINITLFTIIQCVYKGV